MNIWGDAKFLPLVKHWGLNLGLVDDMVEFTGNPEDKVAKAMRQSGWDLIDLWKNHSGTTEDFYRGNEDYLYDLIDFNTAAYYFRYRLAPLVVFSGIRILDYGCGIGTAVFILADQGNSVTGYDINRRLVDFCNFKKEKYKLRGQFTDSQPDASLFDVILAIDVFEHIEKLEDFLNTLGTQMRSGAGLYHYDTFETNAKHPMHFDHSQKITEYLEHAGFTQENVAWAIKR